MDKTVGWILVVITGCIIAAKLAWLAYLFLFKSDALPTDISGPVSGWGTAGDGPSDEHASVSDDSVRDEGLTGSVRVSVVNRQIGPVNP
jgi:predicted permease